MKNILNKVILLAAICLGFESSAQTLGELINTALQNNYQIRILKNEAEIAATNNSKGSAGELPVVDFNGSYNNSFNNTLQKFADGTVRQGDFARTSNINLALVGNWTIFDGFRIDARKEQLDYLEKIGELNSKFFIEQTVSDIALAYYQLVFEKLLLNNYQDLLDISAYRLNIEEKRREIGLGKMLDYGQALVDYQSDSIRILEQKNIIKTLTIQLNQVLNTDLENELSIDENNFPSLPFPAKESLLEQVKLQNQQLEIQRLEELISETELRIARADRYPRVDLFGGVEYNRSMAEVGFIESNRNLGPTVGISVSYRLFDGGTAKRNIKNANLNIQNTKLSREQIHQELDANVLSLYYQYLSVVERIALAESNVSAMEKVYQTASEQLKVGAINGFDFRQTQLNLFNAEITLTRLQLTLKTIEINLNRLSGKVLQSYL